jgi:hypothetical protein
MYYLSAHTYCHVFNDGAVILDLRSGTYLGIDSQYLPSLIANVVNWPGPPALRDVVTTQSAEGTDQLLSDLCRRKILATSATSTRAVFLPAPQTSVSAVGCGTLRRNVPIRHQAIFIVALLRVLVMRRKDRLEPITNWIRRRQNIVKGRAPPDMERITYLLSSFERLRIWFYTANKYCLLDSLVLSVFLSLAREPCSFVIAVSTKPFLAHSWVQVDRAVLNDTVEHVQTFHPLMVIG